MRRRFSIKRIDNFFAVKSKKAKTNLLCLFGFWENIHTACQSAYNFVWPLAAAFFSKMKNQKQISACYIEVQKTFNERFLPIFVHREVIGSPLFVRVEQPTSMSKYRKKYIGRRLELEGAFWKTTWPWCTLTSTTSLFRLMHFHVKEL